MIRLKLLFLPLLMLVLGVTVNVQPQTLSTQFRTAEGEPIHEIRVQGNQQFTEAQIRTALENGPEDIVKAIASLPLPDLNRVILEIKDDGARRVATIIVVTQPNKRISPTTPTTWFRTAEGGPIHEIRIRGNKKITEEEIRAGLEYGPEDISKAIDNLTDFLPYFSRVTLEYANRPHEVRCDNYRHGKSALFRLLSPSCLRSFGLIVSPDGCLLLASNWENGGRSDHSGCGASLIQLGRICQNSLERSATDLEIGISITRWVGMRSGVNPTTGMLRVTAQIHRATTVVAPDLFPRYDSGLYVWYTVVGSDSAS